MLTKEAISPISSPLVPWILVPRSQMASVTTYQRVRRTQGWISRRRLLTSNHSHTRGDSSFVFDIHYLMVHHIITCFVDTNAKRTSLQRISHVFDIENIRINNVLSPLSVLCQLCSYHILALLLAKWVSPCVPHPLNHQYRFSLRSTHSPFRTRILNTF